jgi:hypothetical protein
MVTLPSNPSAEPNSHNPVGIDGYLKSQHSNPMDRIVHTVAPGNGLNSPGISAASG